MDRIYCYPNSDILINKLNIKDSDKLYVAERKLTAIRVQELFFEPIEGQFDLNHLCAVHKHIFQDVYTWAGDLRTVDIAKDNLFCKVQYIEVVAKDIFLNLKKDRCLAGLNEKDFIKKAAYYFSEINALHPFREGNGRAQREFIRQLALNAGYRLLLSNVEDEEMLQASKASFLCDYSAMERLFAKSISRV